MPTEEKARHDKENFKKISYENPFKIKKLKNERASPRLIELLN